MAGSRTTSAGALGRGVPACVSSGAKVTDVPALRKIAAHVSFSAARTAPGNGLTVTPRSAQRTGVELLTWSIACVALSEATTLRGSLPYPILFRSSGSALSRPSDMTMIWAGARRTAALTAPRMSLPGRVGMAGFEVIHCGTHASAMARAASASRDVRPGSGSSATSATSSGLAAAPFTPRMTSWACAACARFSAAAAELGSVLTGPELVLSTTSTIVGCDGPGSGILLTRAQSLFVAAAVLPVLSPAPPPAPHAATARTAALIRQPRRVALEMRDEPVMLTYTPPGNLSCCALVALPRMPTRRLEWSCLAAAP